MGGAKETKVIEIGAAAKRIREHVIYLQQVPGAATAPAAPVHVTAATPIPLPDLPPDRSRDAAPANPRLRGRYPTTLAPEPPGTLLSTILIAAHRPRTGKPRPCSRVRPG